MELCDVHGHFLPGMDDGCQTTAEAVQLLKDSYAQGVRRMFATPHYYPVESIETFLERREKAYQVLADAIAGEEDIPQICLGAEVAYRSGLGYTEDLSRLCLGSSRYLLLEMPFQRWNREILRDVRNICASSGITLVIAHIERYLDVVQKELLNELLEMDVLVQMNAECLLQPKTRRLGRKLLKQGSVHLLGSDCHNRTDRAPNMGKAVEYLSKKRQIEELEQVCRLSNELFGEAIGD